LNDSKAEKIKLLIVDDDELSNLTLTSLLESTLDTRYEIKSLYTGKNIIEEIEKNNYKIVILDEKLPDMSGIEILMEINRNNIKTNVIFLTGYGDEETKQKAMRLGAIDFISKGNYDLNNLIETINATCEKE
jgi:DNA-binding NtrC family response regulator